MSYYYPYYPYYRYLPSHSAPSLPFRLKEPLEGPALQLIWPSPEPPLRAHSDDPELKLRSPLKAHSEDPEFRQKWPLNLPSADPE